MKGTVAPPSSSATVASTCSARTPSSCAIFWLIFATREPLYPSTHRGGEPPAAGRRLWTNRGRFIKVQRTTVDKGFFVEAMRSRHNRGCDADDAHTPSSPWRKPGPIPGNPSIVGGRRTERRAFAKLTPGVVDPGVRQDDDGDCLDTLTDTLVQRLFCPPGS